MYFSSCQTQFLKKNGPKMALPGHFLKKVLAPDFWFLYPNQLLRCPVSGDQNIFSSVYGLVAKHKISFFSTFFPSRANAVWNWTIEFLTPFLHGKGQNFKMVGSNSRVQFQTVLTRLRKKSPEKPYFVF